ncbi:MAG: metallophosphoesterase family protein [Tractidigestivibacter sp.]|jgi:putative phosphoesterase|uniref:metallophosphoesterase family protein n=1 Tax=Tractidigestivibacter sp. TaxID=2847320 RepID=UPI003D8B3F91
MSEKRYDIVSDTHGYLSPELLEQLVGADTIVHAGDICSESDYRRLERIAPVQMCLGNNDFACDYGPEVRRRKIFYASGMRWQVCHYRERLDLVTCDIAICGHTHRPYVEYDRKNGTWIMNPGSPTHPRGAAGPTMGRIICDDGRVLSAEIIKLAKD